MAAPFLDSNILVYAASQDPRSEIALKLVHDHFVISVQCLNEFANVAHRKLMMSWDEIAEISGLYRELADAVIALDADLHARALGLGGDMVIPSTMQPLSPLLARRAARFFIRKICSQGRNWKKASRSSTRLCLVLKPALPTSPPSPKPA